MSEQTILRMIGADRDTNPSKLNHIYLYRIFRNKFEVIDGYTPGIVRSSRLIDPHKFVEPRFVAKSNGERLVDVIGIDPTEGEIYVSTGGLMVIWYLKPNAKQAARDFRDYYVLKRDKVLTTVAKYNEVIDILSTEIYKEGQ